MSKHLRVQRWWIWEGKLTFQKTGRGDFQVGDSNSCAASLRCCECVLPASGCGALLWPALQYGSRYSAGLLLFCCVCAERRWGVLGNLGRNGLGESSVPKPGVSQESGGRRNLFDDDSGLWDAMSG